MPDNDPSRPRFSDHEGEDLMQYQRVSRLAIAALTLACLSPAALLGPLLWIFPIAAAALALASLRAIGSGESGLSGRKTAVVALAVALLFGASASAYFVTRHAMLYRQARQFGEQWFDLVLAGRLKQAHELHLDYVERAKPGASLDKRYARRPTTQSDRESRTYSAPFYDQMAAFFRDSVLKTIALHRAHGRVEFQRNLRQQSLEESWRVAQQFVFRYEKDGQAESLPFRVVSLRTPDPKSGVAHWVLDSIQEIAPEG